MTTSEEATLPHRMKPWSSVVESHVIKTKLVDVDSHTERELFRLDLELSEPLPENLLARNEYRLALSWPLGGVWKIRRWSNDRKSVHCQSWRAIDATKVKKKMQLQTPETKPPNLFDWRMQLCEYEEDNAHWIVTDIHPPKSSGRVQPKELETDEDFVKVPVLVQLLTNFAPLQVQIEVNNITSVETVNQNFSADVTWKVELPAITAIREDSVIRELIDTLEIDPEMFEFTNVSSVLEDRPVVTKLVFGGIAVFTERTLDLNGSADPSFVKVYHLQFSRRVIAVFSEEMSMYYFPFDQQKLSFDFSAEGVARPWIQVIPSSLNTGNFAFHNFKLIKEFDVVFDDKVFVTGLNGNDVDKSICFEIMLERRSRYHVTNEVISAAAITYLSFITYAPLSDGALMEMDARLQIVLTLLLTLVAFRSQVSTMTSQATWMDSYVFCCVVVTCIVALENALFPTIQDWFPNISMSEGNLLGISFGLFTLVNIIWGLFIAIFRHRRRVVAEVILDIHELSRVLSRKIPAEYREIVLHNLLNLQEYPNWALPPLFCSRSGDIFVVLPDDDAVQKGKLLKRAFLRSNCRQTVETKWAHLDDIYRQVNPAAFAQPIQQSLSRISSSHTLEAGNDRPPIQAPFFFDSTVSDNGGSYKRMS